MEHHCRRGGSGWNRLSKPGGGGGASPECSVPRGRDGKCRTCVVPVGSDMHGRPAPSRGHVMSTRVARALVGLIRTGLEEDEPAWMLVEGIDVGLAQDIRKVWPDRGFPPLKIVGPPEVDFGGAALGEATATSLRNQA